MTSTTVYEVASVTADGVILADMYVGQDRSEAMKAYDRIRDVILDRTPGSRVKGIRMLTQRTDSDGYRHPAVVNITPAETFLTCDCRVDVVTGRVNTFNCHDHGRSVGQE